MTHYLFDVDGTLTDSRQQIDSDFKKFFGEWVNEVKSKGDEVFIVTGADKQKTLKQIGLPLYRLFNGVFQNCANQLFVRNRLVYESKWQMPAHLRLDLMILSEKSRWFKMANKNFEERIGMVNFSTVGVDATEEQRQAYRIWDEATGERIKMTEWLSMRYPKLEFSIGGQTSIDIHPKDKDKSQALQHMSGKTIFFGDKCMVGGNDYAIAQKADKYHQVDGWKETMYVLNIYYKDKQ